MKDQNKNPHAKIPAYKIIGGTVLILAGGFGIWKGYKWIQKKFTKPDSVEAVLAKLNANNSPVPTTTPALPVKEVTDKTRVATKKIPVSLVPSTGFPLKKGSKGGLVKKLQQMLQARFGASILPKFGADASFGTEVETALKKNGLPIVIDQTTFNIQEGLVNDLMEKNGIAIFYAAAAGNGSPENFDKTLSLIKTIFSPSQYATASEAYKKLSMNGLSLLADTLKIFGKNTSNKEKLDNEFKRIGLQLNNGKWSIPPETLSGFERMEIITTRPTTIWVNERNGIDVEANTILGREVSRQSQYCCFENNGKHLLVRTSCIRYV